MLYIGDILMCVVNMIEWQSFDFRDVKDRDFSTMPEM